MRSHVYDTHLTVKGFNLLTEIIIRVGDLVVVLVERHADKRHHAGEDTQHQNPEQRNFLALRHLEILDDEEWYSRAHPVGDYLHDGPEIAHDYEAPAGQASAPIVTLKVRKFGLPRVCEEA